jgi:tetratricopeptide (TPR) repeat protein
VQRAELLADLGRYDEAAAELAGVPPDDLAAFTLLARVRLAAGSPGEALAAADAAVAAGPADLDALIVRGLALADLGRVDEAAAQAEQILRHGRGNGYACTSAAAILAAGRTGQVALDAAWEGVRLAPDQPRAHLVLGVVASRLGLRQIAERAYQEALTLDPQLPLAQPGHGMARTEQHRYAAALSQFGPAEPAAGDAGQPPDRGSGSAPAAPARVFRLLRYGTGFALLAPLLVAVAYGYGAGAPLLALVLAGAGAAAGWLAWRRLPVADRTGLPALIRADRAVAVAAWSVPAATVLLAGFGLLGSPWLLVAAVAAGVVALFAGRTRAS